MPMIMSSIILHAFILTYLCICSNHNDYSVNLIIKTTIKLCLRRHLYILGELSLYIENYKIIVLFNMKM